MENKPKTAQLEQDKFQRSATDRNRFGMMVMNPDGSGGAMAVKITTSGSIKYIAKAPPGTAQSSALWQAMKIDQSDSSNTIITMADGNSYFDNVATDLTSLTYS